ncbi:MAG TPA: lipopolysaccharide transport periplasmic protein LptA [Thermodesulfobacteriota bacterium]|nr:lipopolysaccharide transport periplasmic protein LptA [Thermodesulfobacteriota bacterium]
MKKRDHFKRVIFGLLIFLLLFGCGGKKEKGLKTVEGDPEVLYKQGLALFNKKLYKDALEKFEQLKSSFPDSPPYTVWAELKAADSHFFLKEYVEAATAYEEFRKIHPTHEEIAYVQFQIAMSYFIRMTTSDRDQSFTRKALSNFEYLIANYPSNLFTEKAKDKIGICKRQLAEHEFYVGDFYYRQEKFRAAASRFEGLLEKFPRWPDEDKTLLYLGKSYIGSNEGEKATETLKRLVNEFPRSPSAREAKLILSKGLTEKKAPRKVKRAKKTKTLTPEPEQESLVLVKYEEEGKRAVSSKEEMTPEVKREEGKVPLLSVTREAAKPIPPPAPLPSPTPMEEARAKSASPTPSEEMKIAPIHGDEAPKSLPPPTEVVEPKTDKLEGEKRKASLPGILTPSIEKEKPKREALASPPEEIKLVDTAQPIDITSDTVETYTKENLILFKGNVTARQKDMVIYADSLEAVILEGGKGIEKVIAGGNVKIQQGLRVANCEKAVFYNLDKRVILTGDPKVSEGDNTVSGEEIVFDIEQNRIEVKGGTSGRGKVRVYPKEEAEKKE